MKALYFILAIGLLASCKTTSKTTKTQKINPDNPLPIMQWEEQTLHLGEVKRGEKRDLTYKFKNVGNAPLFIELVTSCKCTKLDYPVEPVPPGAEGIIEVTYDSTGQRLGDIKKTIDVIANTDPIVVEAFFTVTVLE